MKGTRRSGMGRRGAIVLIALLGMLTMLAGFGIGAFAQRVMMDAPGGPVAIDHPPVIDPQPQAPAPSPDPTPPVEEPTPTHPPVEEPTRPPVTDPPSPPVTDSPGQDEDPGSGSEQPQGPQTLERGMEGQAVEDLQRRLNELGYTITDIDGVFGEETHHAVVAFQKVNGLSRDGAVGPATRRALAEAGRPEARDGSPGYHVEIDLARQVMFLVQDGRVTNVYDVSTGNGEPYQHPSGGTYVARTPTGQFAVTRRIDGLRHAPLGTLYRPAYFYGGIAIHGSPSVPAYPASHGCVRVTNHVMNQIFEKLPIGTQVVVY